MAYSIGEIAARVGGRVEGDSAAAIEGVAKIEEAGPGQITFLANARYARYLSDTRASAVIVGESMEVPESLTCIRVSEPYLAFMKTVVLFFPPEALQAPGIHATAVIDSSAQLGENVSVGAHVVIGRGCRIGRNTVILPGTVIEQNVTAGEDCLLHARVCLRQGVTLGNRVVLHNGVVIGSDGFGFARQDGVYHKIPQVGTVVIEDDVEIGANSTIDRATLGETRIKKGAKLDNLIQVAHNCVIGENTVIAAQAGISGSTRIGNNVMVGGQAGFAGHLTVGDGVSIGAQSGVSKSVPPDQYVFGYPARPHMEEFRIQAAQRHLPDLVKEIRNLRARVGELEKRKDG